jgi:DNA-binding MarR family transcriptional regulator
VRGANFTSRSFALFSKIFSGGFFMSVASKAFRTSKLETKHATVLSALSSAPQTSAQIAAAIGTTAADAVKKLSILIDEGLAIQNKSAKGASLDSYQLAS